VGEQVTIARRFNGPPDFGHGGYSCGLVAERVDAPIAAVSLRVPPPLERPLDVQREDGTVRLLDGDEIVAEGAPATLELDVPPPIGVAEAEAASATNAWVHDKHPFPTCFGCGPERDPEDGLREILGHVPDRDLLADSWTPHPSLADERGHVTPLFAWSALDCPTAAAAIDIEAGPAVLARLIADPGRAPIVAGEPHVVSAWLIEREGRKSRAASAIHTADGELCGVAEGLWIRLRDPSVVGARV
jgi:hypothetical protein